MIWFWLLLLIGWMIFCWPHLERLGIGLLGAHDTRQGWFHLDIMIQSWIVVGILFFLIEMIF